MPFGKASVLRRLGIAHAAVFGSVARGEATHSSDVDILIEPAPDERLTLIDISSVQSMLEDALGIDALQATSFGRGGNRPPALPLVRPLGHRAQEFDPRDALRARFKMTANACVSCGSLGRIGHARRLPRRRHDDKQLHAAADIERRCAESRTNGDANSGADTHARADADSGSDTNARANRHAEADTVAYCNAEARPLNSNGISRPFLRTVRFAPYTCGATTKGATVCTQSCVN